MLRFFDHHRSAALTPAGQRVLWLAIHKLEAALPKPPPPVQTDQGWPVPPGWWLADAHCIAVHESGDGTASSNVYGMLQGWAAAGGTGYAGDHSRAEQTYRAYRLWQMYGWSPWTTHTACGL